MSARDYLPADPPEFLRKPLMERRDGGDRIDTRLHRASPIHQPPLSDSAHDHRIEHAERKAARIQRRYAIADFAIYAIFVLVLVLVVADRYAHLLPGGGL